MRSLLAFWIGGAGDGPAPDTQGGYRSLLAFWTGGATSVGSTPEPQPTPTDFHPGVGGGKRKRRKVTVEIDGEQFTVRSADEAVALLEQAKELAQQQAPIVAKAAINKSRKASRKAGKYVAPVVAVPEVKLVVGDMADIIARYQREIDELYLNAARDAQLALELKRRIAEEMEEEDITMLLLH